MNSRITDAVRTRAKELARIIAYHQKRYHTDDAPEISDEAYDSLVEELRALEATYPTLKKSKTPTEAVGGGVSEAFKRYATAYDSGPLIMFLETLNLWSGKSDCTVS